MRKPLTTHHSPLTKLQPSYAYCERLARREAGNFFHAFQVLPRPQRRAMSALYAFMRHTDDLADGPGSEEVKRCALKQWRVDLHAALAGEDRHALFPALRHTLKRFAVPVEYLNDVIDGCETDLANVQMPDFATLYRYCYRVASAVGLACIHIWGFRDDSAKLPAEHAGIALQLTNILRDLPEDLTRGRIYLPAEDLERFGCVGWVEPRSGEGPPITDAAKSVGLRRFAPRATLQSPGFRDLMRFQVDRARGYYRAAERLAPLLDPPGRAVFQVMLRTYRGLLDEIQRRDFDVFRERVRLSPWRKAALVVRALPVRWGWVG
jgi:phytoene synthase